LGYEAYRLIVKLQNLSITDMKRELLSHGAKLIEEIGSSITMEIENLNGVIEILLNTTNKNNEIGMSIRFAKPNDIGIVNDIMSLLGKLKHKYDLVYVRDTETKKEIDIDDYSLLVETIKNSKSDFEEYFPDIPHPIRCKDVFSTFRKIHPEKEFKKSNL
jgi:hypothetical protein